MAVNAKDLAVDPLAVLGSQEADAAGNVDGETDSAERRPCGGVLIDGLVVELGTAGDVLPAYSVVHVGLDATGGNGVDSDLLVTKV